MQEIIMILVVSSKIGITSQQIKFNDINTCMSIGVQLSNTSSINQQYDYRCIKTKTTRKG